jgi:hypothetical protein
MILSNTEEKRQLDGPETGYQNQIEQTAGFGTGGASSSTQLGTI